MSITVPEYLARLLRSGELTAVVITVNEAGLIKVDATDTEVGHEVAKMIPGEGIGWFGQAPTLDEALAHCAHAVDDSDVDNDHKPAKELAHG